MLPDFARDVLSGRDIVMLSDGKATRTFCYVADAITGYFKVLVRGRHGEPYNIGTETPEISMRELAEKVVEASGRLFGYRGKFVMQAPQDRDYLVDNPNRRCPIITKARTRDRLRSEDRLRRRPRPDVALVPRQPDRGPGAVGLDHACAHGSRRLMRVSIIGTGYVGLVTGACLCEKGHEVVCVDIDLRKVEAIAQARAPIHEPGLDALLARHVGTLLSATTDLRAAVLGSDLTLIAVGTPFDGRHIDLTYVREAARQIGAALKDKAGYHVVVVKSTVVPGTTDGVVLPILEEASGKRAGAISASA